MRIHVRPVDAQGENLDLTGHSIDLTRAIATTTKRNIADMGSYTTFFVASWVGKGAQQILNYEFNRQGCRLAVGELSGNTGTGFTGVAVGRRKGVDNFVQSGVLNGCWIIPLNGYLPVANNDELWGYPIGTPDVGSYLCVLQERWRDVNSAE